MFISGNDKHSKIVVKALLEDLGWIENFDLGDFRKSRLQEVIMLANVISEIQPQSPRAALPC